MKFIHSMLAIIASVGLSMSTGDNVDLKNTSLKISDASIEEISRTTPLDLQASSENMVAFKSAWHSSHYSHSSHSSHSSHASHSSHYSSRW